MTVERMQQAADEAAAARVEADAAMVKANDAKHAADTALTPAANAAAKVQRWRETEALAAEHGPRLEAVKSAAVAVETATANPTQAIEGEETAAANVNAARAEHDEMNFVMALAIAEAVGDSDTTEAELIAEIPAVVNELQETDIRLRLGEFGSRGVSLEAYEKARDFTEHWLTVMRDDHKSLASAFYSRGVWKRTAAGMQLLEAAKRNRGLPETHKGMSATDRERRDARIERDRIEAEEYAAAA